MKLREGQILVPSDDHSYYVGRVVDTKAVYNHHSKSWHEYAGDDYLGEGDEVFTVGVVHD